MKFKNIYNIELYVWHICQNIFESDSIVVKKTSLRGVSVHGLKMLRYFVFFLKVWFTQTIVLVIWGFFIFQTTSDYLFFFFFFFQITNFHIHFISVTFIKCLLCVPGSVLDSETPRISKLRFLSLLNLPFCIFNSDFIHMPLQTSLILF